MPKRGIVLAGGGARGPYQVGVWRGLRELGIDFQIVTGTSVGALNGAMMVQGDFAVAEEMWKNITPQDVVAVPELAQGEDAARQLLREFLHQLVEHGGLDVSPLENTLRQAVDEERFRSSPIQFGLVTTTYPLLRPVQLLKEEIPTGILVDYLLASASYFPFFQRRKIEGTRYVDGALSDNLPISLALRCGAQELIAVDLHSIGITHRYRGEVPVTTIHSPWDLGQTLVFSPETAQRSMRLGYQDALRAFRRLEGHRYAFVPGETRSNTVLLLPRLLEISRRSGVNLPARMRAVASHERSNSGTAQPSLGCSVTAAAEAVGQLLEVPPDRIYRFSQFNRELLERWRSDTSAPERERQSLRLLHRLLRRGCVNGHLPDTFWALAPIFPKALAAAGYLLALEQLYGLPPQE